MVSVPSVAACDAHARGQYDQMKTYKHRCLNIRTQHPRPVCRPNRFNFQLSRLSCVDMCSTLWQTRFTNDARTQTKNFLAQHLMSKERKSIAEPTIYIPDRSYTGETNSEPTAL